MDSFNDRLKDSKLWKFQKYIFWLSKKSEYIFELLKKFQIYENIFRNVRYVINGGFVLDPENTILLKTG